ncbi:MAG: transposase [Bacilli bacterium]|nr:transposase [Bacilli bacterium]
MKYLFGIRIMKQTSEEIKINMHYRWFLGLALKKIPKHLTLKTMNVKFFIKL